MQAKRTAERSSYCDQGELEASELTETKKSDNILNYSISYLN